MSPFSIKFQANWRKLKIRPFFRTSEISLTHKFYYHHHVQDTRYTLNTKFQANRTRLKFRELSEFRVKTKNSRIFLLTPSCTQNNLFTPYTKFWANRRKLKIRPFFRTVGNFAHTIKFRLSPSFSAFPNTRYTQNNKFRFQPIGQGWNFAEFSTLEFRAKTPFSIKIAIGES